MKTIIIYLGNNLNTYYLQKKTYTITQKISNWSTRRRNVKNIKVLCFFITPSNNTTDLLHESAHSKNFNNAMRVT